ncbi:MAG: FapA family protein, partial [Candidatus Muiribacteriota bacterium]
KVDFKSLDLITNVVKGEVLGELVKETEGVPGSNVLGEEIPAQPGSPVSIETFAGKNVEIDSNGNKIISQIDGQVLMEGEKITVTPVFTVDGDVDLNVGNIDFIGSVFVKGSVSDGFNIRAKGNVEVEKSIGASRVEATGDVIVKGGILGKDVGKIKAGGDIMAKFVENGILEADNEIFAGKAIMHSQAKALKVHVADGKGLIVGGAIRAQEEVECNVLGSHLATKTAVIIGIKEEIMHRIEEIDSEVSKIYDDIDKVQEALDTLENLKKRLGKLPADKEEKLTKYGKLIEQLETKVEKLLAERDKHEEEIEGSQGGKLKVKDKIYPGVTITIRKGVMQVKDEIKFASIVYEDGYLKINPYS